MKTAADILSHKPHGFNYIEADATVNDALHMLDLLNRSYLIVVDENNEFKGIFGEHDFLHNTLVYGAADVEKMKVKEVMTSCLPSVTPETSLEDIIALMYAHHTRYVPVFSGCSFEGLITMYNIMSTMLETREPVFEEKTETERTKTFSLAY